MKRFFKVLALSILAIVCALGCFACTGGEETGSSKGLIYRKYKGEDFYTLLKYEDDGTGITKLDIATAVGEGVTIGRIVSGAFENNGTLTELVVPNTVTYIGEGAFKGMSKIQKLTIPFVGKTAQADTYYGETPSDTEENKSVDAQRNFCYMFGQSEDDDVAGFSKINAVYSIKDGTSSTYKSILPLTLNTIVIAPKGEYSIPMYAFAGVNTIQKIEFIENNDNKIVGIGEYAFSQCASLNSITIPKNVKVIHKYAFNECPNLRDEVKQDEVKIKGFTLESGSLLEEIGDSAFVGTKITTFKFESALTKIGAEAFASVYDTENKKVSVESKIVSVDLSLCTNLTEIPNGCFYRCESLTSVQLPNSITKVNGFAFAYCTKLNLNIFEMANLDPTCNYKADGVITTGK